VTAPDADVPVKRGEIDERRDFDQITRAYFATTHNSITEAVCGMF